MARNREKSASKGDAPKGSPQPKGASPAGFSLWLRVLLSIGLAWHLFAVFISPLSVQPSSEVIARLAQPYQFVDWPNYLGTQWYTDPLYLNHGYHFFAPEPPVNQLIRYTVLDESGSVLAEGEFPNKEQQWPRLYYHRHMMLADQAGLAPGGSPDESLRLSLRSYARYLLRRHEGTEARLDCVRHGHLIPFDVIAGADPNAPETFSFVTNVSEQSYNLDQPLMPTNEPEELAPGATQ